MLMECCIESSFSIELLTWLCMPPKIFLFQTFSSSFSLLSFWLKIYVGEPKVYVLQTNLIKMGQSLWFDHILKNLKLEAFLQFCIWKSNRIGKWLDLSLVRVEEETYKHRLIHWLLQITLSSLFSVRCIPLLPLDHVKLLPLVGRCSWLLLLVEVEKSFIGNLAGTYAPLYSCFPKIVLKSPIQDHGRFEFWRISVMVCRIDLLTITSKVRYLLVMIANHSGI